MTISITTVNVNGIRAAMRKDFEGWLIHHPADMLCLQEVRAPQSVVNDMQASIDKVYHEAGKLSADEHLTTENAVCELKGRAGVGMLTDLEVVAKRVGLGSLDETAPDTGRWIEMDVKTPQGYTITIACVYNHAGNIDQPDKMDLKYNFMDAMTERMHELADIAAKGGNQALICGDFNVAHTDLDLKDSKRNETHSGFTPRERAYITDWLTKLDYVDVVRNLAGDIQGPYTWWSQRGRAFDNNAGWRIDYQFATPELAEAAQGFEIDKAPNYDARWSDHAPLTVRYNV